ncbi:MAG TPA: exopolysaccharide transport family protein [Xanthobacteraceae bacterium]|nr:exopolysaccharide transport family protein [Xanthobacteraceae bacterium]
MQAGVQSDGRSGILPTGEIDLGALGRALWRRKLLIGGLTLLAAAIAFAAVNLITPRYKSEARVLIETRENIFFRPDAERSIERSTTVDQEAVTSQVQLILSRDLAREVIKKLKLAERPEFDPVLAGPNLLRTLLSLTGIIKDPMAMTPEERVFKSYFDRLSAFQVEKSRVIAIEFESQDPVLAAQVANAIAEGYLVLQQAAKQEQTRAAGAWLSGEIDRLRTRVAEAEAKVEQYRAKTNLFVGNNNTTLSNQQLGDFNGQLASARAQKAEAESKAKLIRDALKAGGPIEFSDVVNSELLRRLSEQRVTLRAQLAEQSSTLLDQHPRIKELRAQVADLDRQLRGEADRIARSLENDAKIASGRVESLTAGLDQLKRQAASTNEQDVQLRALERDAKSQRDLLESYLAKYREATARDSIGAAAPDARIISAAVVSNTPSWPKKLPTILVAALTMLVLSSGIVLSGELLGALPTQSAAAGAPVSAAEPVGRGRNLAAAVRVVEAAPAQVGAAPDVIEGLARDLGAAGEGARRITVVGATRDVGATMTAIALARSLSQQSRVVLVDLTLGAPHLALIASDPAAPGLAELVAGSASFGQIITRDRYSRVHLVMAGRGRPEEPLDAVAIMASQQLSIAIEALGRSYDHVVIDAGAASQASLEQLARLAPRAVLVAPQLDDPQTELAREQMLQARFANVSVLVKASRTQEIGAAGAKAAA